MPLDKLDINMLADGFIGTGPNQIVQLDVNGAMPAIDASGLLNLTAANLVGALPPGDASAFTNITATNIVGTLPDNIFPLILPALSGQALTNLNAANIQGNLPSTVVLAGDGFAVTNIDATQNLTGVIPTANIEDPLPTKSAANLTNIPAANLTGTINSSITYAGDGGPLTNLNADNLGQGTLPDARFPAQIPASDGSLLTNVSANMTGDGSALTNLTAGNITGTITIANLPTTGQLPAYDGSLLQGVQASLTGDGSGLLLLPASELVGDIPAANFPDPLPAKSATNLTSIPAAELTGTINSSVIYAGDGGPLTNITAANLSGDIPTANFPAVLPTLDGSNLTNLTAAELTGSLPASTRQLLQVVSHTKVDLYSYNLTTFIDVPDMEISITSGSPNTKFLIFGHLALSSTSHYSWGGWFMRITRDGTALKVGTEPGNRLDGVMGGLTRSDPIYATHPATFHELDDPQVAASTTLVYKVQVCATHLLTGNACTVYVNQAASPDVNFSGNGVSTITVMEVGV
tara:strand:- start:191 stop:1750 length:1560 start_codon:yes stop_codon:yes gene_type:complete